MEVSDNQTIPVSLWPPHEIFRLNKDSHRPILFVKSATNSLEEINEFPDKLMLSIGFPVDIINESENLRDKLYSKSYNIVMISGPDSCINKLIQSIRKLELLRESYNNDFLSIFGLSSNRNHLASPFEIEAIILVALSPARSFEEADYTISPSEFHLYLSALKEHYLPLSDSQIIEENSKIEANARKKEPLKILVVDDSAVVRKLIVRALTELGHHADTALHGKDAIHVLGKKDYDVVIMDLMMPQMDGIDATKAIRSNEQAFDIFFESYGSTFSADVGAFRANLTDQVSDKKLFIIGTSGSDIQSENAMSAGMNNFRSKTTLLAEMSSLLDEAYKAMT